MPTKGSLVLYMVDDFKSLGKSEVMIVGAIISV